MGGVDRSAMTRAGVNDAGKSLLSFSANLA
jgi:hypothetical protein